MELLGGIKKLLHEDGMTIRGVQKLLREQGVRRVADLSPPLATDGMPPHHTAEAAPDEPRDVLLSESSRAERPGPTWPPVDMPSLTAAPEGDPAVAAHGAPMQAEPLSDPDPVAMVPEADMLEDAPEDPDGSAEIVPFLLDTRLRADSAETPDLFDSHDADATVGSSDAPRPVDRAARLPAIPPDPDDAAPLPSAARRPLRGFHKPPGKPDDRLLQLFEKLSSLRGRMH
jgi:hypothetical protein